MENWLDTYSKIVEKGLEQMGVDLKTARAPEDKYRWYMHRADTNTMLMLRESELYNNTKKGIFVAVSPLVRLPKEPSLRAKVMEYMLGINHISINETFTVNEDVIYMRSTSYVDALNPDVVSSIVDNFTFWAQHFHKEFLAELKEQA